MESQLFEVTYEMGVRGMNGVTNPPQKVYQILTPNRSTPTIAVP